MTGSTSNFAASGAAANIALWAVTLALVLVAVMLGLRLRAEARRDAAARRDRSGLARAYSELSAAKSAAEARNSQLEATLSGMSDGVMMLDGEYRLVQWNDRFAELTGVPRQMLAVGVPMADMIRAQAVAGEFGPVDPDTEVARRITLMRRRAPREVVERTRPNGQVVELRRDLLPSGGSVTLYTDITTRRRVDAAQRAAATAAAELVEQKAEFVAMVCNEVALPLDTLLESLRGLIEHVAPAGNGDQGHLALQRALNAGDTLAELMRDILDMSQLDAGRLGLREGEIALTPLLSEVLDGMAERAAARDITLRLDVAPGLPQQLHADGARVRQVMANFVANAVEFANPGEVVLRASRLDLGSPLLRLGVVDAGPRIPPNQAALLFQPFTRLADAPDRVSRADNGLGLGLAICARLARIMGGEVGLSSGPDGEQGGGNEFWMTLPLRSAEPAAPAPPPVVAVSAGPAALPRRRRRALVLLVEDMPVNQVVTATMLRREGHRVDVAASGAQAVAMAAARPYEVVFMDLMMPTMSGYQATAALHALPGPAGRAAIFALTATDAVTDRARCQEAGMLGMLSKPVDPTDLAAAVELGVFAGAPFRPAPPLKAPVGPLSAPAAPRATSLLLDAKRLDALRGSLPRGLFSDLARQCMVDMREQMMTLEDALETSGGPNSEGEGSRQAGAGIEAAAHALAGMAGNYGMVAIERRMRAIMSAARAGDISAACAAGAGAGDEMERTERALEVLMRLHEP